MPRETGGRNIADTGREIPSASDTGASDPVEMHRMLWRKSETAENVQGHAMLAVSLPDRETGPGNENRIRLIRNISGMKGNEELVNGFARFAGER